MRISRLVAILFILTAAYGEASAQQFPPPNTSPNTLPRFRGFTTYVSSDQGATWQAGTAPVEGLSTAGAVDPSPLLAGNGDILIYYFGSNSTSGDPAQRQPDNTWRIAVARSTDDGRTFREEAVVYSENASLTDPFPLALPDGAVRIFISRGADVFSVLSIDGRTFTRDQGLRSSRQGGVPGALRLPDGRVVLFVCAQEGIRRLVSGDGLSFADSGFALRAPGGRFLCDPSPVAKPGGGYVMAYKVKPADSRDIRDDVIYLADSPNGLDWTPRANPVGPGSVPGLVIDRRGVWHIYASGPPPVGRGRAEKLAAPPRLQPVAKGHPRCEVRRRNRGRQTANSSRRLTPPVTKIRR